MQIPVATMKLLVSVICLSTAVAHSEIKQITLEQAIETALQKNLEIKTSERDVEAARAKMSRTTSYFLPHLGAESRYEYFESSFQKQRGATSNLFLEWNVFNGFRDWYDRKAKNYALDQSEVKNEKQKLFTKADTEAKFYRLLAISESIKAYEDAIIRNESQKGSARKRRGVGLASDADLLEFDLYQVELQAEISRLKSELRTAQAEFREVLGETDSSIEFTPNGKLTHYHVDDSLEDLKKRIPKESQSLIAARSAVEQADANKKVAFGGYLPQVDLKATYGSQGINETSVAPETAIMGVARWEFFSGLDTSYAQSEASALAAKAQADLRRLELSTITQLESAFAKLQAVQERVDIEAENKIKARRFFDAVAGEYKRGVKNSADMRAAAQMLLQVLLRDVQYRADFFEQKAILEKSIGGTIKISKGSESGHTD